MPSVRCCALLVVVACGTEKSEKERPRAPSTTEQASLALTRLSETIKARREKAQSCATQVWAATAKLPESGTLATNPPKDPSALRATPQWERGATQDEPAESVAMTSTLIAPDDASPPCAFHAKPYASYDPIEFPKDKLSDGERLAWAEQELEELGPEPKFEVPANIVLVRYACNAKPKRRYEYPGLGGNYSLDAYDCSHELIWMSVANSAVLASIAARGSAAPDPGPADLSFEKLKELNDATAEKAKDAADARAQKVLDKWPTP